MDDFMIVKSIREEELQEKIMQLNKSGYTLHGSLQVIRTPNPDEQGAFSILYIQAMIKLKPTDRASGLP